MLQSMLQSMLTTNANSLKEGGYNHGREYIFQANSEEECEEWSRV
jgi:hypothetical protein